MRSNTESCTCCGRSILVMRTSTRSTPELLGGGPRILHHGLGKFSPVRGDHLLQRALGHHRLDAVLDGLAQTVIGDLLGAARGFVEAAQIVDAPFHVKIHLELFLLARQKRLLPVQLGDEALVEAADFFDQGNAEVQTRLEVGR